MLPKFIDTKILHRGRFLSLIQHNFTKENPEDPNKPTEVHWEAVEYNNSLDHKFQTAVEILPLINSNPKKIIIIGNYRYPVQKFILEFPAGLIDYKEEDKDKPIIDIIKETGKRELKEETGYDGDFKCFFAPPQCQNNIEFTNNVFHDPWKCKGTGYSCIFDVKGKCGEQHLDNEEVIKVFEVELDKLLDFISEKVEKENYGVCTKVYSFAIGLQFKKMFDI